MIRLDSEWRLFLFGVWVGALGAVGKIESMMAAGLVIIVLSDVVAGLQELQQNSEDDS